MDSTLHKSFHRGMGETTAMHECSPAPQTEDHSNKREEEEASKQPGSRRNETHTEKTKQIIDHRLRKSNGASGDKQWQGVNIIGCCVGWIASDLLFISLVTPGYLRSIRWRSRNYENERNLSQVFFWSYLPLQKGFSSLRTKAGSSSQSLLQEQTK